MTFDRCCYRQLGRALWQYLHDPLLTDDEQIALRLANTMAMHWRDQWAEQWEARRN